MRIGRLPTMGSGRITAGPLVRRRAPELRSRSLVARADLYSAYMDYPVRVTRREPI